MNGTNHIIVCIDYLTKWVEFKAVANSGAETAGYFLKKEVFLRHGIPKRIITNRGSVLTLKSFMYLVELWRSRLVLASAQQPQIFALVQK